MKNELNINNKYRVLLTEVLPYEIPLMLNNEGFYKNLEDKKLKDIFYDIFIRAGIKRKDDTIPFNYNVRREQSEEKRQLSIIHPLTQLLFANFYDDYKESMLYYCSLSPFSIRHIVDVAKCTFSMSDDLIEDTSSKENESLIELNEDEIEKGYRSYFKYEKYDLISKFFSSGDNLRLEQKYKFLMRLDISKCFYNIYTHTIAWAIKGKNNAKANKSNKESFESVFDTIMRCSNYGETNGIIVGPEISRIFAELILQRIDVNVLNKLKDNGLKLGEDYEIRRYVDDHFIYAKKQDYLETIKNIIKECLSEYKLYINEKKLDIIERPFANDILYAKFEMSNLIKNYSNKYLAKNELVYSIAIKNEMRVFSNFIYDYKSITQHNHLKYGQTNKFMLSLISKQISKEKENGSIPNIGLLLALIEISFYLFSLDMNATSSFRLCRIIDLIVDWSKKVDNNCFVEVKSRLERESKRIFDLYSSYRSTQDADIEILNLILTLNRSIDFYPNNLNIIKEIFGLKELEVEDFANLNYFQICTMLYVFNNQNDFSAIKTKLIFAIKQILSTPNLRKAEVTMLFLDICVCPYIDKTDRLDIIQNVYNINKTSCSKFYKNITKTSRWFFDWDRNHNLSMYLSKKEYHAPYS